MSRHLTSTTKIPSCAGVAGLLASAVVLVLVMELSSHGAEDEGEALSWETSCRSLFRSWRLGHARSPLLDSLQEGGAPLRRAVAACSGLLDSEEEAVRSGALLFLAASASQGGGQQSAGVRDIVARRLADEGTDGPSLVIAALYVMAVPGQGAHVEQMAVKRLRKALLRSGGDEELRLATATGALRLARGSMREIVVLLVEELLRSDRRYEECLSLAFVEAVQGDASCRRLVKGVAATARDGGLRLAANRMASELGDLSKVELATRARALEQQYPCEAFEALLYADPSGGWCEGFVESLVKAETSRSMIRLAIAVSDGETRYPAQIAEKVRHALLLRDDLPDHLRRVIEQGDE